MDKKLSIENYDATDYFITLRINITSAELSATQYVYLVEHMNQNQEINDELRLNLTVLEQALKDNFILCIARLFDKSNGRGSGDQISIPNLIKNENIKITEKQKREYTA